MVMLCSTVDDILVDLQNFSGGKISTDNVIVQVGNGGSDLYRHDSVLNYCNVGGTLTFQARVSGGVINWLNKRTYTPKENHLDALIQRTKTFVENRLENREETVGNLHASFATVLNPIEQRLMEFRLKMTDGHVSLSGGGVGRLGK